MGLQLDHIVRLNVEAQVALAAPPGLGQERLLVVGDHPLLTIVFRWLDQVVVLVVKLLLSRFRFTVVVAGPSLTHL